MMPVDAFIAVTRFGLGPRPGELRAFADSPRERLALSLDWPLPASAPTLPDTIVALFEAKDFRDRRRAERMAAIAQKRERRQIENTRRAIYVQEVGDRLSRFVRTEAAFRMRLVDFWSNHFTVSVGRSAVVPFAGAYEREAIAPHATGRFADLLEAAVLHPAMLYYLDQGRSVGSRSFVGERRGSGLNENLGREILELHTLGVGGGYSQADVIAMAEILTGWMVAREDGDDPVTFAERRHQPGDKILLGHRIAEAGEDEVRAALAFLVGHPSTARHVATKLVRHFVADEPPEDAVEAVAKVFRDTGGDLKQVALAVLRLDAAWAAPLPKVRSPWDYAVAIGRASGDPDIFGPPQATLSTLRKLGQAPFAAPSPAGWPDRANAWLGPEALMRRIEVAQEAAAQIATRADLEETIAGTIAPVATKADLQVLRRAGSPADALGLLFASPTFQRR